MRTHLRVIVALLCCQLTLSFSAPASSAALRTSQSIAKEIHEDNNADPPRGRPRAASSPPERPLDAKPPPLKADPVNATTVQHAALKASNAQRLRALLIKSRNMSVSHTNLRPARPGELAGIDEGRPRQLRQSVLSPHLSGSPSPLHVPPRTPPAASRTATPMSIGGPGAPMRTQVGG